ncbi:ThiF family adenylyltransferase [Mesorhizobium sp. M0013]|uniref:ThiF family adenylyltransferase n=1 Tax=Mesorhizobium sp. M0013 TaxID=2956841 RepID=UPI0033381F20
MAETRPLLAELHDQALLALDAYFHAYGATRMEPEELAANKALVAAAGWKFAVSFSDGRVLTLAVVVPAAFPFAAARLFVVDGPGVLAWPHLEDTGLLCVYPSQTSFSTERPVAVVHALLQEGVAMIEQNIAGNTAADFRAEFVSYWNRSVEAAPRVLSLVEARGDHRAVYVWKGQEDHIVADSEAALRRWLGHRFGSPAKAAKYDVSKALLLWLPAVPLPPDFPKNGADIRRLVAGDAAALELLGKAIVDGTIDEVLLGARTETGIGFGSVKLTLPPKQDGLGRKHDPINRGFRPGRLPLKFALQRGLAPVSKVRRFQVQRVDHEWIHGRDHDARQTLLKGKRVVIVGSGSLGSTLAELVARAGIGNLYLIDGEVLEWENIGRHVLGAQSVGAMKSVQLARYLSANLPHLLAVEASPEVIAAIDLERLQEADLIVATTGVWLVDSLLNHLQQSHGLPPILYGWLEPNAAAAHAVYIPGQGGCFRCGMSDIGTPDLAVTHWPQDGLVAVPACGGAFTPYGPAELAWAHALLSGETIRCLIDQPGMPHHKIWVGQTANWAAQGGQVDAGWLKLMGDPGAGGMVRERQWPAAADCPVCRKMAQAA